MIGATLIDAGVDKVFVTSSVSGGRAVAAACGQRMIVNLELGGNDPAIVLADADGMATAHALLWGRFFTASQTCVAPLRVLVESGADGAFVAALKAGMLILTEATSGQRCGRSRRTHCPTNLSKGSGAVPESPPSLCRARTPRVKHGRHQRCCWTCRATLA